MICKVMILIFTLSVSEKRNIKIELCNFFALTKNNKNSESTFKSEKVLILFFALKPLGTDKVFEDLFLETSL